MSINIRASGDYKQLVYCVQMSYTVLLIVLSLVGLSWAIGSCPPTIPVDMCEAACGPTVSCEGKQMCCPTACGGAMCVDPMTQRHFVNEVKTGLCPEFPRGAWICTHTCTGDSDCPRTLKCCPNRCGAQTCQLPDQAAPPN